MGLRGSVRAFSLDELLQFLCASGHHGTLLVTRGEGRKTLYLLHGGLYFERATWSFRLGDALVRRGELTHAQLALGLERQAASPGQRLGDVLRELGLTTPERILAARRFQVEEEVYELFGWEDAFFEFEKGALPEGFEARLGDPEEFRFEVQPVLMEAARRRDEWHQIREALPSERRLLVLSEREGAWERATELLVERGSKAATPDGVFDGSTPLADLPRLLGLSRFESQSLVARLVGQGDVRPLTRQELEGRFQAALGADVDLALRLYEAALESPDFEARGRFLDRLLFGSAAFRGAAQARPLTFGARLTGRRAFELLLCLFRQGVAAAVHAREEGRALALGVSRSALVARFPDGGPAADPLTHLVARGALPEPVAAELREAAKATGGALEDLVVGGGRAPRDAWLRALKDAVLAELFGVFFMRRPHLEVTTGALTRAAGGERELEVQLTAGLQAEVMRELRHWETMLAAIPSVRAVFLRAGADAAAPAPPDDPLAAFDGRSSLEELLRAQRRPPHEFFTWVFEQVQAGALAPLDGEGYRARIGEAIAARQRSAAIRFATAAIEAGVEVDRFASVLRQLEAQEAEVALRSERHALRGDLASYSLAEVLQSFYMGKRSGTLRVEAREGDELRARQIYFDKGDVFLLAGDDTQMAEDDLEGALLTSGNLTEDQLAAASASQMKDEVYEIFLWEGAEFEFVADYLPPEFYAASSLRRIRLKTSSFLLEAVRRAAEWEEVRRILPDDGMVLEFPSTEAKLQAISTHGTEGLLLLVDGRHPIAELVRISGVRRFQALSLLAELVRAELLKPIDLAAKMKAEDRAIVSSDLPTSGVIEPGFVGQLQFVATLQDLAGAGLTGVMRLTDGRRSKEMALIEGVPYRTQPYRPPAGANGADLTDASTADAAQDVSECFSWAGARFELLVDTLPPRLADPEARAPLRLDPDFFFDLFAEAGERWGAVAEVVPRDQSVGFVDDDAREKARRRAGAHPDLVDLVDGVRTPEEIARTSQRRFASLSWLATLFEEGLAEVKEPAAAATDDEWDLSL